MSHAFFRPICGRAGEIIDFIMQTEEVLSVPHLSYDIRLACEEMIVNIIHYSYRPNQKGYIDITITRKNSKIYIELSDGGIPFNPLKRQLPDITEDASERPIGGLGIMLARCSMDDIRYKYENGQNMLLMVKNIET